MTYIEHTCLCYGRNHETDEYYRVEHASQIDCEIHDLSEAALHLYRLFEIGCGGGRAARAVLRAIIDREGAIRIEDLKVLDNYGREAVHLLLGYALKADTVWLPLSEFQMKQLRKRG